MNEKIEIKNPSDLSEYIEGAENVEIESSSEKIAKSPRVVIYGQMSGHYGGAREMAEVLKTYLEFNKKTDDNVVISRDIDNIEYAFYKGHRLPKTATEPQEATDSLERPRFMPRLLSKLKHNKEVAVVPSAESQEYIDEEGTDEVKDTLPSVVFVYPKMRQYMDGFYGATVDTPVEAIERLCADNGVPFVRISESMSPDELAGMISDIPPVPALPESDTDIIATQ